MAGILSVFCLLYSLPGPPSVVFQHGIFQLYGVNRLLCPKVDPKRDVIFELYTRKNQNFPQILVTKNDSSIEISNLDFSLKTIMFFHGFLESAKSKDALLMKENYLKLGSYNIILVDTGRLLAGADYLTGAANVEPIGQFSAKFVDYLVTKGLKLEQLHIIGHSLGAESAGFTGQNVKSGKVARITGLDPAGPLFGNKPPDKRLSKDDADFVDIIHTNAGTFGTNDMVGDVDIWVNGGKHQPGCSFFQIVKRAPGNLAELVFCSHYQSFRIYAMSLINSKEYPITKCSSYKDYQAGRCEDNPKTYLGIDIDKRATGNYYITTGVTAVDLQPSQKPM